MLVYNPCPISDEQYCLNGGECFYMSEDPTTYICSCYMPYYGPRCENEAPKQEVAAISQSEYIYTGAHNKRFVDRALLITVLVFIVVTFIGAVLFVSYWIARKKGYNISWIKEKSSSLRKSKRSAPSKNECGVQVSMGDLKTMSALSNQSAAVPIVVPSTRVRRCLPVARTLCQDRSDEGVPELDDEINDDADLLRGARHSPSAGYSKRLANEGVLSRSPDIGNSHRYPKERRKSSNIRHNYGDGFTQKPQGFEPDTTTVPDKIAHQQPDASDVETASDPIYTMKRCHKTARGQSQTKSGRNQHGNGTSRTRPSKSLDHNAHNQFAKRLSIGKLDATRFDYSCSYVDDAHTTDSPDENGPVPHYSREESSSMGRTVNANLFTVASEHDTLLAELFHRGQVLDPDE